MPSMTAMLAALRPGHNPHFLVRRQPAQSRIHWAHTSAMTNRSLTRNRLAAEALEAGTIGLHPRLARMFKLGGFLEFESERGAVLILAGILDEVIKDLLKSFFIEGKTADQLLSEKGGAVGDYFTRSNLAYVLGLISKTELRRLLVTGELRNQFAHVWEVAEFAGIPDAGDKLAELIRLRGGPPPDLTQNTGSDSPERALFEFEAVKLLSELMFRSENLQRRQRYPGQQ